MSLTKLQKLQAAHAMIAELIADELAAPANAPAQTAVPAPAVPAAATPVVIPPATMAAPPSQRHVPPLGVTQKSRPFPAGARRVNQ